MFKFNYFSASAFALAMVSLLSPRNAVADTAAPSLHLKYHFGNKNVKTDMLVNSLKVTSEYEDTYYSLINGDLWQVTEDSQISQDGMYCGLQHSETSTNQIRLYSIWNPYIRFKGNTLPKPDDGKPYTETAVAGDKITAGDSVLYEFTKTETFRVTYANDIYTIECEDTVFKANEYSYITYDYVFPDVKSTTFGGEGRGAQVLQKSTTKSIFENNQWYTFVTRVWDEDNSKFGCWFYDHENNKWIHYCTLGYPAKNMFFKMYIDAFLENWSPSGQYLRSYDVKGAWARSTTGEWKQPNEVEVSGYFMKNGDPDERCKERFEEYNVIVNTDNSISMSTGSGIKNTTIPYHQRFTYPANNNLTEPAFAKLALTAISLRNDTLKWELAEGGLPQFSYSYYVVDETSGKIISESSNKYNSEDRAVALGLARTDIKVVITITDIFDNEITETVVSQKVESNVSGSSCAGLLQNVQPNSWGTMLDVPVTNTQELMDIKIVDESGETAASVFNQPQLMHGPYVHSLYMNTMGLDANKVYTIKAEVGGKSCASNFSLTKGMFDSPVSTVVEKDYFIKYVYTSGSQVIARVYASKKTSSIISLSTVYGGFYNNQQQVMLEPGDNDIVLDTNLSKGNIYYFSVLLNGKPSLTQGFIVK